MRRISRYWLEVVATVLVAVGVWLLVSERRNVGTLDLILGLGILGTLLVTAAMLSVSRRQADDRDRPYIGTVAAEIQSWDAEAKAGWAGFRIHNSGALPGRITSHLTETGGKGATSPERTKGDFLFPGDSINSGGPVALGDSVVKTITYERADGRRRYLYRAEYLVEQSPTGQLILSIIDRSGS